MSDFPIEPDDVRAMRRENGGKDFRLLLRQQIREGNARRENPAPAVAPPKPPGYRAGAWPAGTRPPDPPPAQPPGAWTAALEAYRAHIVATEHRDRLDADPGQTCHCTPCTDLRRKP